MANKLIELITSIICATVVLQSENDRELVLSKMPRGDCSYCCPADVPNTVRFLLYTRKNPNISYVLPHINPGPVALKNGANPNETTIIYLHGFTERFSSGGSTRIKDAYLKTTNNNVILVDWAPLASAPWYFTAVRNTHLVGNLLAKFLVSLDKQKHLPLSKVHVIGFSLGAETAGIAGKLLPEGYRIPRITGLDPAFPGYKFGKQIHLNAGDADFVDIIHTDSGLFGFPTPIGDVDFYPNGGTPFQPGCVFPLIAVDFAGCSHIRAWSYYEESLNNLYGFPAIKCPQSYGILQPCNFKITNFMGIKANRNVTGLFYLETNSKPPFSKYPLPLTTATIITTMQAQAKLAQFHASVPANRSI